jgi:hypothetical protein
MLEDSEIDTPSVPGPYPNVYGTDAPQPMAISPTTSAGPSAQGLSIPGGEPMLPMQPPNSTYPSMTQLLDSGLDWDPFGLSASMAFPTQFSFDPGNHMR